MLTGWIRLRWYRHAGHEQRACGCDDPKARAVVTGSEGMCLSGLAACVHVDHPAVEVGRVTIGVYRKLTIVHDPSKRSKAYVSTTQQTNLNIRLTDRYPRNRLARID